MKIHSISSKLKTKLIIYLMCTALAIPMIFGCGCGEKKQTEESPYSVYYVTKENDGIVAQPYEPEASDTEGLVKEFLSVLSTDSGSVEYRKAIPTGIAVEKYQIDDGTLSLTFSDEYSTMDSMTEVLCRSAVVETLIQIPEIMRVGFLVGDVPLTDTKGNVVGFMTADTFVQNPGRQIKTIQETTLTLYFSNLDGDGLVPEIQRVHFSSNISMDKLVVERLLEGPLGENEQSAIPQGTLLLSVSAVDGVCYVNFDEAFRNQNYVIQEAVVIYSIVDSLTELDGIDRVQIEINGDTSGVYRDRFPLSTLYERNEEIITGPSEVISTEEESEDEK